jgi:hypothetical protein
MYSSYIVVDSPGQLEVFSWSASGKLISDSLATIFPTVTNLYKYIILDSIIYSRCAKMSESKYFCIKYDVWIEYNVQNEITFNYNF